jgi:membrane peptidoglycan carboxypeptidase
VRVLDEHVAHTVTWLLRAVVDHGTGHATRRLGLRDPIAGKTGTSSDRRDAWFAGYSADRVAVAWVGYDDNRETGLSGARAALPIWTSFMRATRPADGYRDLPTPDWTVDDGMGFAIDGSWSDSCPEATRPIFETWLDPLLEVTVEVPQSGALVTRELVERLATWGDSPAGATAWTQLLAEPWPAPVLEMLTVVRGR